MTHTLMELPFKESALEPYISKETLQYHHGKHHAGYVNKLNTLIKGTEYEKMELVEIIKTAKGGIFNNAAQVYNHDFYFKGMSSAKSEPSIDLVTYINQAFGSMEQFKESFLETATTLFGSGWVWLSVSEDESLIIESHSNAHNPLLSRRTPLLTCDVWEHAYYIDYRNVRADYLEKWWELINWEFVSQNLTLHSETRLIYIDTCNDDTELCDYVETLNNAEHINT